MGGEKRGIFAIALSLLVFVVWYSFIQPKFFPEDKKTETAAVEEVVIAEKQVATAETAALDQKPTEPTAAAGAVSQKNVDEVFTTIETPEIKVTFTNYGARPTEWVLNHYTTRKGKDSKPINLVTQDPTPKHPLELTFVKTNVAIPKTLQYTLVEATNERDHYRWTSSAQVIDKIYSVTDIKYDLGLTVTITNKGKEALTQQVSLAWTAGKPEEKKGGFFSFLKRPSDIKMPVYDFDGEVDRETSVAKLGKESVKWGSLFWTGIEDRYFLAAIVPQEVGGSLGLEMGVFGEAGANGFYSGLVLPEGIIPPGGAEKYKFSIFGGPKDMHALQAVGRDLDKAIDYGWFTFIAIPILYTLKFLYSLVHNYGIAIILLTILIKILLYPISKKSMKSMKGMQQLQPRLKELKEKYANDKERLNVEMMQLFKNNKVNPMSGCLPMVLQFPVYIALYRVLWNSIELYQAPFFWFYSDLSQPDPYYITPVLLGLFMVLQQKLTPTATADPAQQKMMMLMPVMFAVFLAFLPVGLVIYILVNTVLTVLQQWMNNNDIRFRDLLRGRFPKKANAQ